MKNETFIFDSHALLKFFQKEKGYKKVFALLKDIKKFGSSKYINIINLGEVVYTTKREFGDQKKLEILANIERLNFIILPVSNSLVFKAAEFKAEYSLSYADCFCLASSIKNSATIVTGDPEFKKVEHLTKKIIWI